MQGDMDSSCYNCQPLYFLEDNAPHAPTHPHWKDLPLLMNRMNLVASIMDAM